MSISPLTVTKPERKSAFMRSVSDEVDVHQRVSLARTSIAASRKVASNPSFSASIVPEFSSNVSVRTRKVFVSQVITSQDSMINPPPRRPLAPMESPISDGNHSASTPNYIEESISRGGAQSPNRQFEDESE